METHSLDPIELAARLIAIDSVNPDLVAGAAGENGIATYCADWLGQRGFQVHRLESRPGRPSIVGIARGGGGGRSLLLNGHTDTVSLAGYQGNPLAAERRDGKIFGRGAFDMKSGVAAMMVAAARVAAAPHSGDVLVSCVADEEFGSIGTEEVLDRFTADAAIIVEPTQLEVTLGHRGFAWFEVVLTGKAAHGSMPDQGIDAIGHAGQLMAELDRLAGRLADTAPHPGLGRGAVRVAKIAGGADAATIAAECHLTIERRMLPGESPDVVETELHSILERLARAVPDFRYSMKRLVGRSAFQADPEWPIVRTLFTHAEAVLGRQPAVRYEPFWTDAGLFDQSGIPCLLFGVDGGGAHAATEWAEIESILQVTEILTRVVTDFSA
jgi:acetylornithine deacetylase